MATYREIHGKAIKSVSTDPSAPTDAGQVWYNTTSNTFKSILNLEAWSSSSSLITARARNQGAGTQTAGLSFGGKNGSVYANTEEYNGTGWAAGGALPSTVFDHAGDGVQTSAFSAGGQQTDPGSSTTASAEYDGTSWTAGGSISTARKKLMGLGVSNTAGLIFGGQIDTGPAQTATEEYDGSSWTAGGSLNTARAKGAGSGTQTAGLGFGGYVPGAPAPTARVANTEEYNGSSWSEVNDLNNGKDGLAGFGTQTASMAAVGYLGPPGKTTATEIWDGTNWTTSPATVASARNSLSGAGTTSAGWIAGGYGPPGSVTSDTEEYNSSVNVITGAAWAAGGSISTVRTNVGSTSEGSQTAAMVWGGRTGPPPSGPYTSNKSDEYNGSSFTATPNLNTAARTREGGGTTTAAWCAGGEQPVRINNVEEYDGSSWTTVTAAPIVVYGSGTGAQTAGLLAGLESSSPPGSSSYPGISLEYDGTNWATGGSPSDNRYRSGCSGTQTAGTLISGYEAPPSPGARLTNIEEYNGTSWTSGGSVVTANAEINAACRGPQTATLITGGFQNPSPGAGSTQCSNYDGTATATTASMGTGRRGHGSDGGQTSGLVMTGQSGAPPVNSNPNYTANAEELTAETTAVNVKTLTQS